VKSTRRHGSLTLAVEYHIRVLRYIILHGIALRALRQQWAVLYCSKLPSDGWLVPKEKSHQIQANESRAHHARVILATDFPMRLKAGYRLWHVEYSYVHCYPSFPRKAASLPSHIDMRRPKAELLQSCQLSPASESASLRHPAEITPPLRVLYRRS
jgi:hypothetical protein